MFLSSFFRVSNKALQSLSGTTRGCSSTSNSQQTDSATSLKEPDRPARLQRASAGTLWRSAGELLAQRAAKFAPR